MTYYTESDIRQMSQNGKGKRGPGQAEQGPGGNDVRDHFAVTDTRWSKIIPPIFLVILCLPVQTFCVDFSVSCAQLQELRDIVDVKRYGG